MLCLVAAPFLFAHVRHIGEPYDTCMGNPFRFTLQHAHVTGGAVVGYDMEAVHTISFYQKAHCLSEQTQASVHHQRFVVPVGMVQLLYQVIEQVNLAHLVPQDEIQLAVD